MPESGAVKGLAGADIQLHWGIRVPLRDGICLSATLYLPTNYEAPPPAILAMTPYIAQSHHLQGVYFAEHGYSFVVVDVRGRGNSEGAFHPLGEAKDAYDVVEWLARQPYCNGKVAMWGGSYLGYCQWAAAREAPPHLATIVPVAAPFRGVDSPFRNNVFTPYTMQWLTIVSGRTSQERLFVDQSFWTRKFRHWFESGMPFKELDVFLGNPSALFQEWISHPHRDAYWDSYNPTSEQYSQFCAPVLTITGAYDADQLGALAHYREHIKNTSPTYRSLHYLVIGPWDHAGTGMPKTEFAGLKVGTASLIDLPALHLQWYAWTMQDAAKPQFLQKNVAYYVMGAEKWRYADTLEAITARAEPLYLQSIRNATDVFKSGSLTPDPPGDGAPDQYIHDPRDVSLAELECTLDSQSLVDQRMIHAATGKQLIYHSLPFAKETEISGFFNLCAWLSIDQPDTDFHAAVYEVELSGTVIKLTTDWIRARYRGSFREPKLIETQEPLRYDFENFMFVSRQVKRGHRLRLVIGPINSIFWQKNYNSGGIVCEESIKDAKPVTVKLFHDKAHPSALYIPIAASSTERAT